MGKQRRRRPKVLVFILGALFLGIIFGISIITQAATIKMDINGTSFELNDSGTLYINGTTNITGLAYYNNSIICTRENGLCNTTEVDPVWNADKPNYLTTASAALTYLTIANAASTYQPIGSYASSSDAAGWTNTSTTTSTSLNVTIRGILFRNTTKTLTSSPIPTSAVDFVIGRSSGGASLGDFNDIALQYGNGGFKHFIVTRHHNVGEHNSNAILFYLNNGTTGTVSSAPGTGNVFAGGFFAGNGGSLGINTLTPTQRLDVNGSVNVSGNITISTTTANQGVSALLHTATTTSTASTYGLAVARSSGGSVHIGADANYGYLQSFNSKPIYVNPAGNGVVIGAGSGNLSVGTTSSTQRLEVNGSANITSDMYVTSSAAGKGITLYGTSPGILFDTAGAAIGKVSGTGHYITGSAVGDLTLRPNTGATILLGNVTHIWMKLSSTGIGIGTNPTQKLDVNGSIAINGTTEIQANSTCLILKSPSGSGQLAICN